MTDYESIIQDALRTRYGIVIDNNYTNIQEACDYIATLPENSILVFAWHQPRDLRLQSAAWERGLAIEDLMQSSELAIRMSEIALGTEFYTVKKHLMLVNMDTLIAWYHKKPKSTKSIIRLAKKMGLPVIENPAAPTQLSLFD
jgi:hypothetical protein